MKNILFEGVYSAIFSIYDRGLHVIKPSVEKLVAYNLKNGIRGFYVGGNTGECTVLPNHTRMEMLETVKGCAGDAKIIAHVGAGHLDDTLALMEHANQMSVDAVSSLPPSLTSYYKGEEAISYYRMLAAKSKSPVLAYVTPVLSCDPIWFAKEIMKIDNIIGLKLTIPDYHLFEQVKQINHGDIELLNGPDECMLAGLCMGADGAIGTSYNLMPKTACSVYESFKNGDICEALEYQHKLNRLIDVLLGSNISNWKLPLELLGIDPGYTVAPAKLPDEERKNEIFDRLKKCGCAEEMV